MHRFSDAFGANILYELCRKEAFGCGGYKPFTYVRDETAMIYINLGDTTTTGD